MTYLMKFKPIDVGYKFFALNDAMTGWCYVVIPEGYADDEKKKEGKRTWDKVADLVRHLPYRKEKQYVACMDNYFTYPKTIKALEQLGVATVRTARTSTMPPEIRDQASKKKGDQDDGKEKKTKKKKKKLSPHPKVKDKRYNAFYYMDHKDGFRCFRWIDNNVVKFVSNVHTGSMEEVVTRPRKRPRTKKYRKLWKGEPTMKIKMPQMVDNYNMWMKVKFLVEFVLKCRVMQNSDILTSSNYAVILN